MNEAAAASYEKTLVSYVDTLGFSAMIENSRQNAAEISKLRNRLAAMKQVATENTEHRRASGEKIDVRFSSFSFSDLVVRCTRIGAEPPWFILLLGELHYLASRQLSLAAEGVLLRGAVTMGDLLVDASQNVVFGPALVRAYELERRQAIYPRIVVDGELVLEATKSFRNAFNELIRRADDGTYFLDYLSGLLALRLDPPMKLVAREGLVRDHRRTIEAALHDATVRKDESVIQKYRWLSLYHNAAVRRLEERLGIEEFRAAPDLLVPEDALNV